MGSINMKSKQCTVLSTYHFAQVPQIFYISDQIHLINFQTHHVLNPASSTLTMHKIFDFTQLNVDPGSMRFIKSKQSIIGRSWKLMDNVVNNSISEYSLINNTWNHYNEKWFPLNLISRVGVTAVTKHEDFIFSIAAESRRHHTLPTMAVNDYGSHILVYDVHKNTFKIGMKVPSKELSFITITSDENKDKMVTNGFVHSCETCFRDCYVPGDLVDYIQNWICFETVHFIADDKKNNYTKAEHWKIDVDLLIESQEDNREFC